WCSGMTEYFYKHQIRIFDYPKWAEPLRDALRTNMERIAAENGTLIEFGRSRKSTVCSNAMVPATLTGSPPKGQAACVTPQDRFARCCQCDFLLFLFGLPSGGCRLSMCEMG